MHKYSFSYRKKEAPKKTSSLWILHMFSLFFTLLKHLKNFLSFTLLKIVPLCFKIIFSIFFKLFAVPGYQLTRSINKKLKIIFKPAQNKLLFLFYNRYVVHGIAIIIIIIVLAQNFQAQTLRAEDFGKKSTFAKIHKTYYETYDEIIEEKIDIESLKSKVLSPKFTEITAALEAPANLNPQTNLEEPETTALTQGGTALIKPDIASTFDTPKPRDATITYTVKPGDTIFDIAENFNISVNTILWSNKLSARSIIRPGDKLTILPVSGIKYIIKKGDTISSIAKKQQAKETDIIEFNKLGDPSKLIAGQELIIPDGRPYTPPRPKIYQPKAAQVYQAPKTSISNLFWPTNCSKISQYFKGWRHTGVDIACGRNEPIYAAQDGVVEKAGWNAGGYGYRIIIKHTDGTKTLYAHLLKNLEVKAGQQISKGEVIAHMGSTGKSTGPHLHFEVIIKGTRYNPLNYL